MRSFVFAMSSLAIVFSSGVVASGQTIDKSKVTSSTVAVGAPGSWRPYTARTYSRHAINHAQTLQYYATSNQAVPKETAQEHAGEIRRNVDAFGKEIAKLPKEFENDPEATKLVGEIRMHQAEAAKHCGMLESECAKHTAAGGAVAQCCTDMLAHLRAADEAHDKLMKHLGIPLPGAASKK